MKHSPAETDQLFTTTALPTSEKELQKRITDLARKFGWMVNHTYRARLEDGTWRTTTTATGWPDLLLVHPGWGRVLVLELKGPKGKVEPDQARWVSAFQQVARNAPGVVHSFVVYPADLPKVSRLITRRAPS